MSLYVYIDKSSKVPKNSSSTPSVDKAHPSKKLLTQSPLPRHCQQQHQRNTTYGCDILTLLVRTLLPARLRHTHLMRTAAPRRPLSGHHSWEGGRAKRAPAPPYRVFGQHHVFKLSLGGRCSIAPTRLQTPWNLGICVQSPGQRGAAVEGVAQSGRKVPNASTKPVET